MSEIELKPCPVCGSENVTSAAGFVVCKNCNVSTAIGVTQEESNRLWNTRPLEDALRARAEKAEAMIDKLIDAGNDLYMAGLPDGYRIEDAPAGEWAAWDELVAEWQSPANGEVRND